MTNRFNSQRIIIIRLGIVTIILISPDQDDAMLKTSLVAKLFDFVQFVILFKNLNEYNILVVMSFGITMVCYLVVFVGG